MASHTPHQEQCKDCKCKIDEHVINDENNLCQYNCHSYCDCYLCMQKVEERNNGETIYYL